MGRATIGTEAILLTRRDSGEHGLLLIFLARDHGLLAAFKRTSSRSRQALPDLFDEVSLTLEKAQSGDLWFVTEYLVQKRRPQIGADYHSLLYASRYALLLTHHLFEPDEALLWMDQLRQALTAWEKGVRPECAYFKALYLFARLQGIPVAEEWFHSVGETQAAFARSILRRPLTEQVDPPTVVERLITDFENYLHHRHDIRFGT